MKAESYSELFTPEVLDRVFPSDRANQFFEALFGDADEGAYDIRLSFDNFQKDQLEFKFELIRRPDKCLVCNLTYGLPQVFSRHPVVNVKGLISEIEQILPDHLTCNEWQLGDTQEFSADLHIVPLHIQLNTKSP